MGRRKIAIERIKDPNKRYVAFTKRRQGLFKKADTACRMYGSQIGIIVFSPTGRLYSSGPVDSLIHQFLHQSSSSSSYSNLEEDSTHVVTGTTTTTTTSAYHIEDGKKRSRSGDDDDDRVPMMPEERETKKRKLLMSSTTTTTEAAAAGTATDEKEEEETNVDYNIMGSVVTTTTTSDQLVASSFLESDHDDELGEVLHGFADYIIADHPYEETSMFDLLPHQGVYDDDDEGCFAFCDNWPRLRTMDDVVQDQVLIS